jgi:hypothetical protein
MVPAVSYGCGKLLEAADTSFLLPGLFDQSQWRKRRKVGTCTLFLIMDLFFY